MEARELRIGNFVLINAVVKQITPQNIVEIHNWNRNNLKQYRKIHPIPLTQEWLERLGFSLNCGYWQIEDCLFAYFDFGFVLTTSNDDIVSSEIKYVHQLQNLYFAITGKEL